MSGDPTYPGGFADLLPRAGKRRPYTGMAELLTPYYELPHSDLWVASSQPAGPPVEHCAIAAEKFDEFADHFAGRPLILTLHALTIAASRRDDPPEVARDLFLAIWRDCPHEMIAALDTRWKLSALQTFIRWGETEEARRAAACLTTFFQMLKLTETERLFSGFAPQRAFRIDRKAEADLPLALEPFSIRQGDLDRNLLAALWLDAEEDATLRPLACHLLNQLNRAESGLFHRLKRMRGLARRVR